MTRIRPALGFGVMLCSALLFSAISVSAQGAPGSIRGRVVLPSGGPVNESVLVRLETNRGVRNNSFTDNQGQFSFRSLAPGIYEVIVEPDRNRFDMSSTTVEVFPNSPSIITITLKEKKKADNSKAGETISAGELDPAVPAAAKKEFDRAAIASNAGKSDEAIAGLKRAIALYPRYLKAHNDLGAQFLVQGKFDEAAEALNKAIEIEPKAFNPHLNLGMVFFQQQKFPEAVAELTKALSLEPNSPSARLYLGQALAASNDLVGAEKELKIAYDIGGANYALALFHLGQVYLTKGDRETALKMFETYLAVAPSASNAGEVKKLIGILK